MHFVSLHVKLDVQIESKLYMIIFFVFKCFLILVLVIFKYVFSCGVLTHTTDQCRTLDESFPFLPTGWQTERIGEQYILGPGPPARPQSQQMGNAD